MKISKRCPIDGFLQTGFAPLVCESSGWRFRLVKNEIEWNGKWKDLQSTKDKYCRVTFLSCVHAYSCTRMCLVSVHISYCGSQSNCKNSVKTDLVYPVALLLRNTKINSRKMKPSGIEVS